MGNSMTELMDIATAVHSSASLPSAPVATSGSIRGPGIPLPLVARMVAKLVAGRPTAADEIPALVETVSAVVARILNPTPIPAEVEIAAEGPAPRTPRRAGTGRKPAAREGPREGDPAG